MIVYEEEVAEICVGLLFLFPQGTRAYPSFCASFAMANCFAAFFYLKNITIA